jgi:hypothetical protein
MMKPQDAFHALLEGERAEATPEAAALATLAAALAPVERPGPDPRFKARLRSELLAAATATQDAEVEAFAAMLEASPAAVPAAMRPLVAVAKALEPIDLPVPTPAFRYQLRNRLVQRAEVGPSIAARLKASVTNLNTRMRRSLRVVAGTGMAATILAGSSGAMAVASTSLPVDKLYTVKMAKESAELWFRSGTDRGFVHLGHARTRLDEVRGMLDRPVTDQAPYVATLRRMDDKISVGQTIIFDEFKQKRAPKDAVEQVDRFARQQLLDLAGLRERLPAGAQPAATDSLTVLAMVIKRASELTCDCDAAANIPADALVRNPATTSCACGTTSSGQDPSQPSGNNGGTTNPSDPTDPRDPNDPENPEEPGTSGPIDVPEVPGDPDADEEAENLINDLLNQLPLPSETTLPTPEPPIPTLPALPDSSDTLDSLTDDATALTPSL